jgi:dihydroxyacetone kinase DhaK subunit
MKKNINNAEDIVMEMCEGIVLAHPELELVPRYKIIKRKQIDKNKVSLISGGGSGHEPAHAGFVGHGMLTAAVCGDVFASPSTTQVYNTIKHTKSDKGTLLIIKNYSGDCMNFDAAAEMAQDDDGITVESVYVNDDIAVEDSLYTVGRRGVCGTILVHKIAGAAAEMGKELCEVKRVAQKTIDNVKSIGVAFTSCTVPAKGTPTFELSDNEIEFGVGIHGEPGIERQKMQTSSEITKKMIDKLTKELNLNDKDEITLMVNGFGSTPLMELYIANNDINKLLTKQGVKVYKTFVGNYMTALDMAGFSITILKLDEELKVLLDSQVDTGTFKN